MDPMVVLSNEGLSVLLKFAGYVSAASWGQELRAMQNLNPEKEVFDFLDVPRIATLL